MSSPGRVDDARRMQRWRNQLLLSGTRLAVNIRDNVHGPVVRQRGRRTRHEISRLLPDLLSTIPACPDLPDPTTWTTVKVVPTVTDVTVAFLSTGVGAPIAVLRMARTAMAAQELRANHDVLATLFADPRLTEIHHLLPQTLAMREDTSDPLAIERYLPTTDLAAVLTRAPDRAEDVIAAALAAIAPLHRDTGRMTVANRADMERWVDSPLEDLRTMCRTLGPAYMATVDHLGALLREALHGRCVRVSWTHGDFTPGNVLLDQGRVSGIVDWGGAQRDLPSVLDPYLMLIAARCVVQRRPLGSVVAGVLSAGHLDRWERNLLAQEWLRRCGQEDDTFVAESALTMLAWLHHVAGLCRKCDRYRENRVWWMLNAEPVLQAVSAVPPRQGDRRRR
jgi:hypothetical protein